jgi:hypothetical protein
LRRKKLKYSLWLWSLCLVVTQSPFGALAQSKEEKAHKLYLDARNYYQNARFEDAVTALEQAYGLFPQPIILVKLAEAYEKLGQLEKALDAYRQVGKVDDEEVGNRVINSIRTLEAAVSRPVQVHFVSKVPGVRVDVGGKVLDLPAALPLKRGPQRVRAVRDGYKPLELTVDVAGQGPQVVEIELSPMMGSVVIRSATGSFNAQQLWLDDIPLELQPGESDSETVARPLPSGRHTLVCGPDLAGDGRSFYVQPGMSTEVDCGGAVVTSGASTGGDDETWAWVAASGALASTVAGALLLVDYENDKDLDASTDAVRIVSSSKPIAGGVLVGLGGALAITSALLFFDVFEDDGGGVSGAGIAPLDGSGAVGYIGGTF